MSEKPESEEFDEEEDDGGAVESSEDLDVDHLIADIDKRKKNVIKARRARLAASRAHSRRNAKRPRSCPISTTTRSAWTTTAPTTTQRRSTPKRIARGPARNRLTFGQGILGTCPDQAIVAALCDARADRSRPYARKPSIAVPVRCGSTPRKQFSVRVARPRASC